MAKIKILVGTVYGNALDTAESCADWLRSEGHSVEVLRNPQIDDLSDPEELLLVCTSTTGQGEIPDELMLLYCQLQDQLPDLQGRQYGLITLGDSSYPTFAEAGYLIQALFQKLQMQCVGEPLIIDACETLTPVEDALPWVQDWANQLVTGKE